MKSDWKIRKLNEIAVINPKESLPKGSLAKKISMDKIVPYCRDIPEYEIEEYSGGTKFRNGDIIMARITPCLENGKISQVNILDDNEIAFGSTEYIVFRASQESDPDYLYYLVTSDLVKGPAIKSMVGSSGRQRVQTDVIQNLELKVPPIADQRTIGHILSSLDNKISLNRAINQNLEQQAHNLFNYFVSNAKGKMHRLSEYADINPDTYSPKDNWDYVNYLDTSNITAGVISEVQIIDIHEDKLPSRARRKLKEGDIVYSTVRPNQLHYGIISQPLPNMLGSTGFAVIRTKNQNVPNELLYLALTVPSFVEQMQQLAEQSVSTFPSIRPGDLDACEIPEPSESEKPIISAIKACFSVISNTNAENRKLSLLRDTLLPRLMSGELDVSEIEL